MWYIGRLITALHIKAATFFSSNSFRYFQFCLVSLFHCLIGWDSSERQSFKEVWMDLQHRFIYPRTFFINHSFLY